MLNNGRIGLAWLLPKGNSFELLFSEASKLIETFFIGDVGETIMCNYFVVVLGEDGSSVGKFIVGKTILAAVFSEPVVKTFRAVRFEVRTIVVSIVF